MIITQLNSGLETGRQATGGLFRDRRQQSRRRVKACAMDRPPSGTCHRVKIPALRPGSFSLWSHRHVGVPGTPLGAGGGPTTSRRLPERGNRGATCAEQSQFSPNWRQGKEL
jgi:hypothetical protein